MLPEQILEAANKLYSAELSGRQCDLLSVSYPSMSLNDAYSIQAAYVKLRCKHGAKIIGWKVGLTSRTMQRWHDVKSPTSGVLLNDMVLSSGAVIPEGKFIDPRVEAEIAFVMRADLQGFNVTRADVIAATDYVVPAVEILDTRMLLVDPETGGRRKFIDNISDNAGTSGIVLGKDKHDVNAVDLRWVGAILMRDGFVEETGLAAGVLNDPVAGIVWLIHRLAEFGEGIRAGNLVLSGAFLRAIDVPRGSYFEVDFGPFGHVDLKFS